MPISNWQPKTMIYIKLLYPVNRMDRLTGWRTLQIFTTMGLILVVQAFSIFFLTDLIFFENK